MLVLENLLGYKTQRRIRNTIRTLWFGEIEKIWLQNPNCINRLFLSLKNLLIDGLWCPLNTDSNGSQFRLQTNKLWTFSHCYFCCSAKLNLSRRYQDFFREQNIDLLSCYRGDSKFQLLLRGIEEVSRLLSRYMLKKCCKCVFLELFLSKLCVFNLFFNYNFKTHQNSIKDT